MPKQLNELWGGTTEFSLKSSTTFSTGNFRTSQSFADTTRPLYTEEHFDNSAFNTFVKNQPFFNLVPMGYYGGSYLPFTVNNGNITVKKSLQNNSLIYPVPVYRSGDISSEFEKNLYPNVDSDPYIYAKPIVSYDKMYKLMISDNNRGSDYISLVQYNISEKTSSSVYLSDIVNNIDNENVFYKIQYFKINPFVSGNHEYDFRNVSFMHLFENNIPYGKFNVMTLKESPIISLTKTHSGSSSNMFSVIFNNNHFCYGDIKNDINIPVADFENGYYNIINPDDTSKILFNKTSNTNYQLIGFLYSAKDLLKLLCFLYGLPIFLGNSLSIPRNINSHDVLIPEILPTGEITGNWAYGDEIPEDYVIQDNDTILHEKVEIDTSYTSNDDSIATQYRGISVHSSYFLKYYLMTQQNMINFSNEIKLAYGDEIFNVQDYIVSILEIPRLYLSNAVISTTENIKIANWEYQTAQGGLLSYNLEEINLGSLLIERHHYNFLDYEPYTTLMLYVPFCGMVTLPTDFVMGHKITLYGHCDFETGHLIVEIYCRGGLVTSIEGNCSRVVTFSASSSIQKIMGVVGSISQLGVDIINTVKNPFMLSALPADINNIAESIGTNYITLSKGKGTSSSFAMTNMPCLYRYTTVKTNQDGFKKSVGNRCERFSRLNELTGLTVCQNPIINVTATDVERTEIYEALQRGVIL